MDTATFFSYLSSLPLLNFPRPQTGGHDAIQTPIIFLHRYILYLHSDKHCWKMKWQVLFSLLLSLRGPFSSIFVRDAALPYYGRMDTALTHALRGPTMERERERKRERERERERE
jgi:hypothetical protein